MTAEPLVIITTGDSDGIGLEVAVRALSACHRELTGTWVVVRNHDAVSEQCVHKIPPSMRRTQIYSWDQLNNWDRGRRSDQQFELLELVSSQPEPEWVELSARKLMDDGSGVLVTGPLSKTRIQKSYPTALGHTEILANTTGVASPVMSFWGPKLNLVLVTAHQSLDSVPSSLTADRLKHVIRVAYKNLKILVPAGDSLRLGVLGLNPHAGENGILGDFETNTLAPILDELKAEGIPVHGPLVPDAAFLPKQVATTSCYVCMYHDQGLIPFKTLHGQDDGVQMTLGLPFWRVSVDHGTAKELFNKNQANAGSMTAAIQWAQRLRQTHPPI